ncbi:MAG: LytTR family transcriptional regulator DNA-binding domain-containing protein [Muribaculaceae bacterium]|nr:LytTR family transcriptional regulator DNA-binding domain-containing protein [Muribaculaceae bacterium]
MSGEKKKTITIRIVSVCFAVVVLAIFKPFGLDAWQWQAYAHLLAVGGLGIISCFITEAILVYILKKPGFTDRGVDYIIRRNLWFQLINTPLVSLMICLYRHFVLSDKVDGNRLSWGNFFETLVIMAFCSFLIGLYWRFKFRSKYLAAELEETKQMNEQLQRMQQQSLSQSLDATKPEEETQPSATLPNTINLDGNTSESVTIHIPNLLYIESVGNYVKVVQLHEGKVATHMLRATSKQIEEKLSNYPTIVRCHRAFLVNLRQVEKILSKTGTMQLLIKHSNDYLPVSRSNMPGIKQAIARQNYS